MHSSSSSFVKLGNFIYSANLLSVNTSYCISISVSSYLLNINLSVSNFGLSILSAPKYILTLIIEKKDVYI